MGRHAGLTGLITLVTTGIILTGRTATTSLTPTWRIAVTLAIVRGLALAILGLWHTLAAEVGARIHLTSLNDILATNAGMQDFKLLTGSLLTWWPPAAPTGPPAHLKVTGPDGTVSGTLASADGGTVRVIVAGAHNPVAISMTAITNMAVTAACP